MKYTFYFILSLLLLSSCSGRHTKHTKKFLIDSLTSVVYDLMGDEPERAMSLVDSLEREGVYSSAMANCRRAQIASEQYEPRQSEVYALRALKDPNLNDEREDIRYFIYNLLINAATNVGNTEQALKYSVEATTLAKADTAKVARLYLPDFLVCIGSCQFKLNRHREGNENFDRAWASYEELLVDAKSFTWFYPAFMLCVDAVNNNVSSDSITLAMRWQPRLQKIYEQTVTAKDIPDHVKDDCTADMEIALAKLFAAAGQRAEAEKHFAVFRETAFSQTAIGQKYSSAYLEQMGRWRELAATMENADTFFVNNQSQYTSDYLQNVLARKFNAQMRLHNHEAALQTASRLVALLDTVQELERKDDAAKLAVIYETQEKEQKIAQQQADLTQQRLVAVIVAFVLMVVFFVVYTLNRRAAARRLAKVTAQKERIESELRIARDIQMSMVPNTFPNREGLDMYAAMKPAREVGGDLYSYVLNGHQLYFCLGDVSGKGVPASLFMSQATKLFQMLANQGMQPSEICTQMNDVMSGKENKNGMFVTFFVGLIDLESGHLSFCNAGHNPPVIGGTPSNGDLLKMESNAPLGLWTDLKYVGEEIESIKGRTLFFYTDGLTEAENHCQEQFGEERLLRILRNEHFDSSKGVIDTLAAEVEKHRDGAEPNDDLTMLCIRVTA